MSRRQGGHKLFGVPGVPTLSPSGRAATPEEEKYMSKFPYQEAVGALMWTTTMTRPDTAYAVQAVARFWNSGLAHY